MSIYTPHGLKIRFETNYAFVTGAFSFYFQLNPYQIGLYTFLASVIGGIITTFGIFVIPGLPKLGVLYNSISVLGILFMALLTYGFFSVGLQGITAFLIGRILAGIVNTVIGFWKTKEIYSRTGIPITTSEINFYNAYRIHAYAIGKSTDISVSDEELKDDNWIECYKDLATKWPEIVQRFENY